MDNGEKIVFHDEEVKEVKKGPSPKTAIIGIILVLVYAITMGSIFIFYKINNVPTWFYNVTEVLKYITFFLPIILGAISFKPIKRKNLKGKLMAVLCIVLPPIIFIVSNVLLFSVLMANPEDIYEQIYCSLVEECKDNGDGTSKCTYLNEDDEKEEITCSNDILDKNKIKHEK